MPDVRKVESVAYLKSPPEDQVQLKALVNQLLSKPVKSINLIVEGHLSGVSRSMRATLVELANLDDRVILGISGYHSLSPVPNSLPAGFRDVGLQVYGTDIFKESPNTILRQMPFGAYRGGQWQPLLPTFLAGVEPPDSRGHYMVHFIPEAHLPSVTWLQEAGAFSGKIADRHVFIGIQSKGLEAPRRLPGGMKTHAALMAVLSANLIEGFHLKPVPSGFAWVQSFIYALLFLVVWRLGIGPAVVVIVFSGTGLVFIHGFMMSQWNLYVPMAETVLFATMTAIFGGLWRMEREAQLLVEQEVKTQSIREMGQHQGRLLEDFAQGLAEINEEISTLLKRHAESIREDEETYPVFIRLMSSVEELRDYLAGIRSFSRITSRRLGVVRREEFYLLPLLDKVALQFQSKCFEKNIEVEIRCPESLKIKSAAPLLDHILSNLLSNAIKHSSAGQTIRLAARLRGRRGVDILVVDQGPGIKEEYQEKIFEKFFRIPEEQRTTVGNGLGLFLCRYFAQQIGGSLSVSSARGAGSTFRLFLKKAMV